jgi:hypothetical protein
MPAWSTVAAGTRDTTVGKIVTIVIEITAIEIETEDARFREKGRIRSVIPIHVAATLIPTTTPTDTADTGMGV